MEDPNATDAAALAREEQLRAEINAATVVPPSLLNTPLNLNATNATVANNWTWQAQPVTITYTTGTATVPVNAYYARGNTWQQVYIRPNFTVPPDYYRPPPQTREQIAEAIAARNREYARRADERRRRELEMWGAIRWEQAPDLTPTDIAELREHGHLTVRSTIHRFRTYHIPFRAYSQVQVIDRVGNVVAALCLQPVDGDSSDPEWVAIQKMLILADEERYLRTANHFPHSDTYRRSIREAGYLRATPNQQYSAHYGGDDDDDDEPETDEEGRIVRR